MVKTTLKGCTFGRVLCFQALYMQRGLLPLAPLIFGVLVSGLFGMAGHVRDDFVLNYNLMPSHREFRF